MNAPHPTRVRLEPQRTVLSPHMAADVTLAVGVATLADAVFHHEPPTPAEMERAIDVVEDAIMATQLQHGARGELHSSDVLLGQMPGLESDGARLTRDEVESLFQRLASATLGSPNALAGMPANRRSAAALLILRECMHHLGYESIEMRAA